MNLLHDLANLLSHIVGDPVHTQSATAIQTTIKALGTHGTDETQEAIENKVAELVSIERAITPEEWAALKEVADDHLAAALKPEPVPEPEKQPTAS